MTDLEWIEDLLSRHQEAAKEIDELPAGRSVGGFDRYTVELMNIGRKAVLRQLQEALEERKGGLVRV